MALDAKDIVRRLKGETTRHRVTLYLDHVLLREFRMTCESLGVSPNRSLEEMMREFIESAKGIVPKKNV